MKTTPEEFLPLFAPGAQVMVRDEEWFVRSVDVRGVDGMMLKVIGRGELVRDQEATFFTELDYIEPLRPDKATLSLDDSPAFRRSRLFIEALLRKTPLAASETRLAIGPRQLLNDLEYQKRPAQLPLEALRPRLLIADSVGLGKTLEVGILLSELIRRSRGERILVASGLEADAATARWFKGSRAWSRRRRPPAVRRRAPGSACCSHRGR